MEKKLWNNVFFLILATFLVAPLGLIWMWVDKGFTYKKSTKLIVTVLVLASGVATFAWRASVIEKYPELEGQPNTVLIQQLLEK